MYVNNVWFIKFIDQTIIKFAPLLGKDRVYIVQVVELPTMDLSIFQST